MTTVLCRAQYPTNDPTARIVRCDLPKGHAGSHDELIGGEPGINTWPNIITFVTTVATGGWVPRCTYANCTATFERDWLLAEAPDELRARFFEARRLDVLDKIRKETS